MQLFRQTNPIARHDQHDRYSIDIGTPLLLLRLP